MAVLNSQAVSISHVVLKTSFTVYVCDSIINVSARVVFLFALGR